MQIVITSEIIKLHFHAATNGQRRALECIYFDKAKNRAVATDGHTLGIVPIDLADTEKSFAIPASTLAKLKRPSILDLEAGLIYQPEGKQYKNLNLADIDLKELKPMARAELFPDIFPAALDILDDCGPYPNYDRVLPGNDPVYTINLSFECLNTLIKAFKKKSSAGGLAFSFAEGGTSAVKVAPCFQSEGEYGLVMPMKSYEDQHIGLAEKLRKSSKTKV